MKRPVCPACYKRPVAVNYRLQGKTYYRSRCDRCIRNHQQPKDPIPTWIRSGYQKKDRCEKCNFRSRVSEQISVWYIDNNEQNNSWSNLRSVCSNCRIELVKKRLIWNDNDLKSDF